MSLNYTGLRREPDRQRIARRLLDLRHGSLAEVRRQRDDHSFLLATWNIRDFDSNKFGWGHRLPESLYYLAETISCFDLVAIQEVNEDLDPFERLIDILGRAEWDYLLTDVTEGPSGNRERMAYLFRRGKVRFRNISGEIVLPQGQLIVAAEEVDRSKTEDVPSSTPTTGVGQQFARSPYLVAFQCGWFRFSLCTVHIYYGEKSGPGLQRRIEEIHRLVAFFAGRQDKEISAAKKRAKARGRDAPPVENYILLGDFNVVSPEHETMKALKSKKFEVPKAIDGDAIPDRGHFYDQIAVRVKDRRFSVTAGGIVDVFADVFTDTRLPDYEALVPPPKPKRRAEPPTPLEQYRQWRTWQMSDHSPLWVKIEADFADDYLTGLTAPDG
jgi:endonuclease/exonuclease/phosphatase family metal-dependent hydrolase